MSISGVGTREAKRLGGGSGDVSWYVSGVFVSVSILKKRDCPRMGILPNWTSLFRSRASGKPVGRAPFGLNTPLVRSVMGFAGLGDVRMGDLKVGDSAGAFE